MPETMDRRRFLALAAGSVALGALVALPGCGGGSSSDAAATAEPTTPSGPSATYADKNGVISSNHGHSVRITAAQQQAGSAVKLGLSSGNGHTHSLYLTAADVAAVASGARWSKVSSTDAGHDHQVTFN